MKANEAEQCGAGIKRAEVSAGARPIVDQNTTEKVMTESSGRDLEDSVVSKTLPIRSIILNQDVRDVEP